MSMPVEGASTLDAAPRAVHIPAMDETLRARADARLEQVLAETGRSDPRGYYRDRLRTLRERDPAAFRQATGHFEEVLLPRVAGGDADPLEEWLEYGRLLAQLEEPGRTVAIDRRGRARSYGRPAAPDALILHLPDDAGAAALVVGLPPELSAAQRATYDLLVRRRTR
jgi:hypothetical protein